MASLASAGGGEWATKKLVGILPAASDRPYKKSNLWKTFGWHIFPASAKAQREGVVLLLALSIENLSFVASREEGSTIVNCQNEPNFKTQKTLISRQ